MHVDARLPAPAPRCDRPRLDHGFFMECFEQLDEADVADLSFRDGTAFPLAAADSR
jgi:hypothetical protein